MTHLDNCACMNRGRLLVQEHQLQDQNHGRPEIVPGVTESPVCLLGLFDEHNNGSCPRVEQARILSYGVLQHADSVVQGASWDLIMTFAQGATSTNKALPRNAVIAGIKKFHISEPVSACEMARINILFELREPRLARSPTR